MKQSQRISMGSFPYCFQGLSSLFWGFWGSSIKESQIRALPMKIGVKAWQMLKFSDN
jgi:hypothetical protein